MSIYVWLYIYVHVCVLSHFSGVWLSATLWTVTCQTPLSMGFSRQEYCSGFHALLQGIFLTHIYNLFFFRFFSLTGYYNICCCCPVAKSRPALGNPTNCSMPGSSVLYRLLCVRAKPLQSCPTLCDPMDCSPPGYSVHGIPQARILEWVAMPSSRDLPNLGIEPASHISCIARWILYH